jgi:copper chaperone CopZ
MQGTGCHVERIEKPVDPQALQEAERVQLVVTGMGCPNCAMRVHNALVGIDGVLRAEVDERTSLAEVWIDTPRVELKDLIWGVAAAGAGSHHQYRAAPMN